MKKPKKVAGKTKPATKDGEDVFDLNDEIVIGITKKGDKPEKKKDNSKNDNKKKSKKKNKIQKKKNTRAVKVAKISILIIIVVGATVAFLMSPVFDVKNITVTGNKKLSTEQIISLSGLETDKNTFKMRMGEAQRNIKENSYIESVKVSRKLPSEISIDVTERIATYMLEFVNSVVYINNQGYMIEITDQKIPVPIITGIDTPTEEFKEGGRLNKEDLQKLETVLKILDTLENYDLATLVTGINIADKNNFTVYMDTEGKTIYLGNASNINTRIMYLKEILEREKGIQSEIFINKDVNKDDIYTREKV